jgi:hypothetical protein
MMAKITAVSLEGRKKIVSELEYRGFTTRFFVLFSIQVLHHSKVM